jgi:hypothetical protein
VGNQLITLPEIAKNCQFSNSGRKIDFCNSCCTANLTEKCNFVAKKYINGVCEQQFSEKNDGN